MQSLMHRLSCPLKIINPSGPASWAIHFYEPTASLYRPAVFLSTGRSPQLKLCCPTATYGGLALCAAHHTHPPDLSAQYSPNCTCPSGAGLFLCLGQFLIGAVLAVY